MKTFSNNIMDTLKSLQNQNSFTFTIINPTQIKITKPNNQYFYIFNDNNQFYYKYTISSSNKFYYDDEDDLIYSLINL